MSNIAAIISDLKYGRTRLVQAIEGLSRRELTELPIYESWTIKDVLAHVLGWDLRVLNTLPLMLQNRASEVASVEVDEYNLESINTWRHKSFAEILVEVQSTHRQILQIISGLEHREIDTRRERHGRVITIRSYVIDVMIEHDREHAAEIELWRKNLEQSIDPVELKTRLAQRRADFAAALSGLSEADLMDKRTTGSWSVKDIAGHIADWERLMLNAARHIHDPSLPVIRPVTDGENEAMVARHAGESWDKTVAGLTAVQQAVDDFVARLKMGDWTLRGPYPWPDDGGSLAELLGHVTLHYDDHIADLQNWRNQVMGDT